MTRLTLLSTSDTDLLSARSSGADWVLGNPSRLDVSTELPALLSGSALVVVRILGSARSWRSGLDTVLAAGVPVVVLGGEQTPDAELMEYSTVPIGVAAEAHRYLAYGGPANLGQLHAFLSDTVLLGGDGFEPPAELPEWGVLDRPEPPDGERSPRVGVLFYRAHHTSGNVQFAHDLADAIDATGTARGVVIHCASLRGAPDGLLAELGTLDALVVTVLAAGGTRPAAVSAGGEDEAWDVGALAALDIPILQALCLTWSRDDWAESDDGVSPLDSATQIAVPEFDGRIITVPFSFKELGADGLPRYVTDPERCRRVAGIAVAHARLRHVPPGQRRIAIMLSAYPTKHSRVGNAVGLDTPVSAIRFLRALRDAGYDLGDGFPGLDVEDDTEAGNALIHALIDAGGQDEEWLTAEQLAGNPVRVSTSDYLRWTDDLPAELTDAMAEAWGPAPGRLFVDGDAIVLATLQAGNVVLMIQPPRGFGENPVAIYHDPDMAPSHHYLAAYKWVEHGFGADAVVHLGKHGSMEWLPGKNAGLSAACATDAAIGNLPLIYPFLVNDPGEGAQAKRRAHATIVDHLIPPMARAESYGDIARLEQLLDEYSNIAAMDPAKLPAIRAQIWTLIQAAKLDHDLGLDDRPHDAEFDDFLLHVDGWLCEVKDAQIRDGLHILGAAPTGEARVNLVLSILRAAQVWGGKSNAVPGLRTALGLKPDAPLIEVDRVETVARSLVQAMEDDGWNAGSCALIVETVLGHPDSEVERVLAFATDEVVPRLAGTTAELDAVLHALDGGYVPAGPSGSPLRGLVNVLPTGRNFYTVDPKAVPSRLAYDTGVALADNLIERYLADTGEYPQSVGLSVWGTSAMRTAGDDIAEVLALIGVRPEWDAESRRVKELSMIPLEDLGRPRIDVTVRISGFFRDAFPHVIGMLDDAIRMVAALDEPDEQNFVRAHARRDEAEHGDADRAVRRIFGSKPGSYGAGILQLIDSGNWRTDADLAEVYTAWGGFAYGRGLHGVPAADDMRANYRRIAVAAKNTDTREHDIADSDDYFQYHGGMVATVRALTGADPKAYIGDSTTPDAVRTRSLAEETARVFRARVVNPRWIGAMRRHGYKGAFELAATVDYLFGYDATAGVVEDWMYESLAQNYALDPANQQFLREANPWALRGIVERLTEAADRGLWSEPDPETMNRLQQAYLDVEGDLEDRG
ncbi:cobaltochelatase subunit CobN [Rhodococcus rhodochrous]|uniref:cobaltochelatase subunit CobN n=1 Tax=Rhodococcus rhodochrous TaxID=1829 RepID=UPI001E4C5F0A|nr:cobaltochelatase subunit CobN [Rhodococcus rhodochrous]MCD2099213.1 cobaltochelatase subunit CobN [Rhodococcus rhodochrous]MCD2120608.1 cobaltochelatase subunit CobN [Rhodococcus rhodochrous]MCQ4136104.1 cobaltochelatase subunit CobN [Rhodococcus rhodochrous]MDJ0017474.1 cobaltochelatase subunit CobN [Rhodococcus rhodochrous]